MPCKGRHCRSRFTNLAFFITCLGLVILGIYYNEGQLTSSSQSDVTLRGQGQGRSQGYTRVQGHFKYGKKKRKKLHGKLMKALSEEDLLECKIPVLSLRTDSNAAAFKKMEPLHCNGQQLMYFDNSVLKLNKTVLGNRKLKECKYYSIEWSRDPPMEETYNLVNIANKDSNFEVKVNHDFVKVECYLQESKQNQRITGRKLLNSENSRFLDNQINTLLKETKQVMQQGQSRSGANKVKDQNNAKINSKINYQKTIEKSKQILGRKSNPDNQKFDVERKKDGPRHNQGLVTPVTAGRLGDDDGEDNTGDPQYYGVNFFDAHAPDFEQYLVQIAPEAAVFDRQKDLPPHPDSTKLNVLMLALDSMSHLSYQRKLPLTYAYLRDTLGAAILNGYNIVGDATTAALIPMFTGKTETELPETRKNEPGAGFVDSYNLIWNRFEHNGYVTLYAEDMPSFGTFNLRLNGFEHKPTDHYMRPFWNAIDDYDDREQKNQFCLHGTPKHRYLLKYVKQFFTRYRNVSKFAFGFYGELSHADNSPAEYMDRDMVTLLKYLKRHKHLDNTLLIVMGDHGARYRKVRHTVQGKLEERLPLMTLTFPQWFREKHPDLMQNLRKNAHRLTTPFDMHVTLETVLDLKMAQKKILYKDRGISLLNSIPMNRTCESAGVAPHWCSCMVSQDVDVSSARAEEAASKVIDYINGLTSQHREKCSVLHLDKILSVRLLAPNEQVLKYFNSMDADQRIANFTSKVKVDIVHYQITLVTSPSNAMYESTLQYNIGAERLEVTPDISRINIYGNQPYCVQKNHPDLRKYCFCADYQSWEKRKKKLKHD